MIFGHHFTSIAGTGPIVGPAIAVFWGWLPALLWVLLGCIFIGAVHDFGALVVSLRNRGQTVGEIAGRMIAPRARVLFLLILFFSLTVVLAIFGLVIATIFRLYPESVLSVWVAMPLAVLIGFWVYRWGGSLFYPSLFGIVVLYLAVIVGAYYLPIALPEQSAIVTWTVLLMIYCFFASVLARLDAAAAARLHQQSPAGGGLAVAGGGDLGGGSFGPGSEHGRRLLPSSPRRIRCRSELCRSFPSCSSPSPVVRSADSTVWSAAAPAASRWRAKRMPSTWATEPCCWKAPWRWSSSWLVAREWGWANTRRTRPGTTPPWRPTASVPYAAWKQHYKPNTHWVGLPAQRNGRSVCGRWRPTS